MAQQHYDGKKHKKNAARADLLEQLGKTLDMGEMKGTEQRWNHEEPPLFLSHDEVTNGDSLGLQDP